MHRDLPQPRPLWRRMFGPDIRSTRHFRATLILTGALVLSLYRSGGTIRRDWREFNSPKLGTVMGRAFDVSSTSDFLSRRPSRYFVKGRFEFELDGQTYTGTEFGRGGESVPREYADSVLRASRQSGLVRIRYEPDDPSECYVELQQPTTKRPSPFGVLTILVPLCVVLWMSLIARCARLRKP